MRAQQFHLRLRCCFFGHMRGILYPFHFADEIRSKRWIRGAQRSFSPLLFKIRLIRPLRRLLIVLLLWRSLHHFLVVQFRVGGTSHCAPVAPDLLLPSTCQQAVHLRRSFTILKVFLSRRRGQLRRSSAPLLLFPVCHHCPCCRTLPPVWLS